MGGTSWDSASYAAYSTTVAAVPTASILTSRSMSDGLNPLNIKVRESCDSVANPQSTPLIVGVDVTGSMGELAGIIVKKGLGVVMENVLKHKPITDPHFLMAAIGDVACGDRAPLQITQFEADSVPLIPQIESVFLEGGGGGNNGESYSLLWYFAANKTKCDSMIKRNHKGYLFTIGDERVLPTLTRGEIKRVFGDDIQDDINVADLLDAARQNWEVFHIVVHTSATDMQNAIPHWKELLSDHVIVIQDHSLIAETIVATMRISEGEDTDTVISAWDGSTKIALKDATKNLVGKDKSTAEVVRL